MDQLFHYKRSVLGPSEDYSTHLVLGVCISVFFLFFRCSKIFPNPIKTLVKIEKCEVVNESEQMCEVEVEDWNIKNEEIDIKEEELESNKLRYLPTFCM